MTGIWEKKLRDIEHGKFDPAQFVNELKQQITQIVWQVLNDRTPRRITVVSEEELAKKKKATRPKAPAAKTLKAGATPKTAAAQQAAGTPPATAPAAAQAPGQPCPVCGQGTIIKGRTAYGCSRWREGCTYRKPF